MSEAQPATKYVLAIDMGTGGPKIGLVDQQGRVVSSKDGWSAAPSERSNCSFYPKVGLNTTRPGIADHFVKDLADGGNFSTEELTHAGC
jgi:ribulose kinase